MDNESKNSRLKEFVDYLRSDEFRIKTISTCCVIIAATLVLIAGELYNIYKGINAVTDLLEDGEYNRVAEIFYEEETPEDVLPILGATSTTEATNSTEDITEKTTNKKSENTTTSTTTEKHENDTTSTTKSQSKTKTYVINKSSKKIHTKDCSFVDRMKEENKQTVQLTSDELNDYIDNGYTTCSSCGG